MASCTLRRALTVLCLCIGLAQVAFAQFDVDAVSVRGVTPGATRLDVYTRVPHTLLNFTNVPTGYQAKYQVTLDVFRVDTRGRRAGFVVNRVWDRTIPVTDYASTRTDRLFDRTTQSLDLAPGRYLFQFQVEDLTLRRSHVREVTTEVRALTDPVAVSDLILIERYDEGTNAITPTVSNLVNTEERSFKFFYEIYADRARNVRVTREVSRERDVSPVRTALGLRQSAGTDVAYTNTAPTPLRPGRNQFVVTIPMSDFRAGDYSVRVRVHAEDNGLLAETDKRIEVQWNGLNEHIQNIDEAIAQLAHIAKTRDMRHIRDGATEQERINRFRAFWQKLDPTPGTERNERMEEYYYRVAYANRSYGNFGRGWQTDRGLVLIKFGEPGYVERHPYNFNTKPYEVWYYPSIGKRFIFVDKTGLGDFELLVPIWDERNRM